MAKKKRNLVETPLPPIKTGSETLVNDLTVDDARHLLLHEGQERTPFELILELTFLLVTSGLVAYAIWQYQATPLHLLLPLVAQYMALNFCLPLWQLVYRLPALNKFARNGLGNVVAWPVIVGVVTWFRARQQGTDWGMQVQGDLQQVYHWIVSHQMHWPIISSFVGTGLALSTKFRLFRDHGPPFISISIGCVARIMVLLLFGLIALPISAGNLDAVPWLRDNAVWFLWAALFAADLLAFYMIFDIRRRLKARNRT